jgi:MFS family permease
MLGLVSLFMDTSSELVHSLLPVFMASVLGASMTTIGIIEGVAEATVAVTKVFSGAVSDYLGKRKALAVMGYGLAALTKPIFPLAQTIGWVFTARFVDRIGKGIRGAPRDALVADIVHRQLRGAAYGLRQSLDSVGAFLGPLLAILFLALLNDDIRLVLWVAIVPAFVSVALLVFGVKEPENIQGHNGSGEKISLWSARRLPSRYWWTVSLGAMFTLARFSEAFLVLRVQKLGLELVYVPLVLIVMNVVYTLSAYPAGIVADRINARTLLVVGLLVLIVADGILASASAPLFAFLGVALWGLHMGLTQGLFAKLVADAAPTESRGSAFGIFNLVTGVALLLASVVAGVAWSVFGPEATFGIGAGFALLTVLGLVFYLPHIQFDTEQKN